MKILHITTQKPHSTGSGTYLTELVRSFDRGHNDQAVVAGIYRDDTVSFPDSIGFYPVYYTEPDVETVEDDIPFPVLGMSDSMPYPSTRYSELNSEMARILKQRFLSVIERAVRDLDPDLIICHHLYLLTAIVRNGFRDRRIYGICHGSDLRQFENCSFETEYIRAMISQLDGIFALHGAQKKKICELFGVRPERVDIIGSGYNSDIFNTRGRSRRDQHEPIGLIYAGKLCTEKGLVPFFDALDRISEGYPERFRLSLAGGCNDDQIKALLGVPPDDQLRKGHLLDEPCETDYLGVLSQKALANSFRRNDIFILPSYYEGLPLVLIEAMACGLRTICSDLPGVREWIDSAIPENDTVFIKLPTMIETDTPDKRDLPDFAEAIASALGDVSEHIDDDRELPDTSGATWDAVTGKIICFHEHK